MQNRNVESDDYLGEDLKTWRQVKVETQSFLDLPEAVELKAGETKELEFTKGELNQKLMLLFPQNSYTFKGNKDKELTYLKSKF